MSGQPADARVPQIARALSICQQQRRQLGQLRAIFLQRLAGICAERQDINQRLAVSERARVAGEAGIHAFGIRAWHSRSACGACSGRGCM